MTATVRDFRGDPAPRGGAARPAGLYAGWPKRLLDILLVLAGGLLVLPVMAVIAALVASDGHPVLYRQARLGRGGRVFPMWKFRTMVPDAEARLAAHLAACPAARAEWEAAQKLRDDPRITAVGRVLRKTSLDELPQLWNVLRGEMSLVGPRPMMVEQRALYPGTAYFRHRPGITGPWQVAERNLSSFRERALFDDRYDRTVSLGTDLAILARTVGAVLRGTGC